MPRKKWTICGKVCQLVNRLKSAKEEGKAIDQGIVPKNANIGSAKTMAPMAKQEPRASEAGKNIPDLQKEQVKHLSKDDKALRLRESKTLSSFLALPVELHLQIIQVLAHGIDPGLLDLRGVNRYCRSIISPTDFYTWGTTLLKNKEFKAADRLYGFLRVDKCLPCTLCQCLLPKERFHMQAKQGKKALGHKLGHTRFCVDCGIKHRKFGGGNSVRMDDQTDHYKIVCRECFEFLDQPEGIQHCYVHYRLSESEKQRLKLLRLRDS